MTRKKIIVLTSLLICISGCSFTADSTKPQKDVKNTEVGITYKDESKQVMNDNLLKIDKKPVVDGITYQIKNMTSGAELGKHDKEKVNYLTDEVDANGNLKGSFKFETAAETVYISPEEEGRKPSESFHCLLKAGESRELELSYLIDVNNVKDNPYYGIRASGAEIDNVNNKFFDVGEFWNEE